MAGLLDSSHTRIIFFTGAPDGNDLNWDEEFLNKEAVSFFPDQSRVQKSNARVPQLQLDSSDSTRPPPRWRGLSLAPQRLRTGLTQSFDTPIRTSGDGNADRAWSLLNTSFFTTTSLSGDKSEIELGSEPEWSMVSKEEEVLSQFYDHSLTVHEELPSSIISSFSESLATNSSITESIIESPGAIGDVHPRVSGRDGEKAALEVPRPRMRNIALTDLARIPNASYLRGIQPQTKTVNLVISIISIPAPRTVKLRQSGKEMEIIEMIVGDETKAGFGVTFWLSPISPCSRDSRLQDRPAKVGTDDNGMRTKLEKLRPQDIVLLQNAALAEFKGQVHGQSLRRDRTTVQLLYRRRCDSYDEGGMYGPEDMIGEVSGDVVLMKTRRVREWALNFVGGHAVTKTRRVSKRGGLAESRCSPLPPDTE